ncbi:MAG: hypothetical protein C5B48_05100 [Candidatus Rokuibacteriota bacterium]|nr:MAG: hypothetical protein C5B48_05100 [Candidatus Rokubacteria bacterium]
MTAVSPETAVAFSAEVYDIRRFWRVLLAVIAPLPWLGVAIYYGLMPEAATLDTPEKMSTFTTNHAYTTLQWSDMVFVLLVVPATLTAAWVARRGAPRLATAAALMMVTGFLAGIGRNLDSDQLAYVATQKHLDPATTKTLVDGLEANPTAGVGSLLFIVGLVFGSIVLSIGLWRSRAVPPWVGVAVAVGGSTHPFLSFDHVLVAVGLVVMTIGFAGVSAALLRMRNDDFDLPPLEPSR